MDRSHPEVLPTDERGRRAWLRHWLPGVPAAAARELRRELVEERALSEEQVDRLLAFYAMREIERAPLTKYGDPSRLRRWVADVLRLEVRLVPGRHAILRDPTAPYLVEVVWLEVGKDERRLPMLEPKSVRVVGDDTLGWYLPDLQTYLAAFMLKVASLPARRGFTRRALVRPTPGQPPKVDFYRRLRTERDRLVAAGERAPAKVLGELLDVNPATVRSWLKRSERYLGDTPTDSEEER